ncbi:hypothetical protein VPH49_23625 [Pseudomonas luteola]|uniref:hypothetical protein n=1 Tax=Pseudomonas luteola TaxID=47886 RepID=UPI003A85CDC8
MTKRSRHFGWGLFAGGLLWIGTWLVLLVGQLGHPFVNNLWVEGAYAKKLARAASIREPKIVVVAGSSAMFGVNTKMLEQALGRPAVNLGVNAGILSPYLLIYARQAVHPGDWVILPLEYPLYHDRYEVNQVYQDYWLSHPVTYGLNAWRLIQLIASTPLERVAQGYLGVPEGFTVAGLYGAQNLDDWGDQLISRRAERSEAFFSGAQRSAIQHYGAQANSYNGSWALWQTFASEVNQRGGCAVFLPAPMLDRPDYHSDPVERNYYESLSSNARQHGLNYIGEPFDFLRPEDDFFDTNYHLVDEARMDNTARIIEQVKPLFSNGCKRLDQ